MTAPKNRVVEANGLGMSILEAGSGPLILLCHGFPETSHAWRHQVSGLAAAGFHAVAPDLRGFGDTEASGGDDRATVFDLVADMVALVGALRADRAVIVGNDWGASLAWQAALMRPDLFQSVVALGVPMMTAPPLAPSKLFPRSDDALFYTLYLGEMGAAEAELDRDPRTTLRKIFHAASGEAGPRRPGDGTPNPFGMVSRADGLLGPLPDPSTLPRWLAEADLDAFAAAYRRSGFRGGLNLYRNMDRNWELQRAYDGARIAVPALFIMGERDTGLAIPGMDRIIADMPALVPQLRETLKLPGCGHWVQQERAEDVTAALVAFAADPEVTQPRSRPTST